MAPAQEVSQGLAPCLALIAGRNLSVDQLHPHYEASPALTGGAFSLALRRHLPYTETAAFGDVMKSVRISAVIGLAIGIGPAITAHLMPPIAMLDQLGAVILGLIIGMQAASRRRMRYDRRGPAVREPLGVAGLFYERDGQAGRTSTWREPQAEHFISRPKSGNGKSP
jgi:hypothetical protein